MGVFIFHGAGSWHCNAVFSSLDTAAAWIRQHGLTGMVTRYELDDPEFEQALREGTLPSYLDPSDPKSRQRYTGGRDHWHYYLGLGPDEEGYNEAFDRWHEENASD